MNYLVSDKNTLYALATLTIFSNTTKSNYQALTSDNYSEE